MKFNMFFNYVLKINQNYEITKENGFNYTLNRKCITSPSLTI